MYKVLILDGDRSARYGLKRFPWSRYGFEVSEEAAGGHEALSKLAMGGIDLVVTDVRVPDMNGLDFLEAVRRHPVSPCLILLSSYYDFVYAQQGIGIGVFDYMTKPLSEAAFGETLQRAEIYLQKRQVLDGRAQPEPASSPAVYLSAEKEQELKELLLSGNIAFLSAAKRLERLLAPLPDARREPILLGAMEHLYQAMDAAYPWVRNLEKLEPGYADRDGGTLFLLRAKELFALMVKYELAKEKSLLRAVCRLVYQEAESEVSLHSVAAKLHISADYAGRIFKRKTGINFITFVTRVKMEKGKTLLEQGHWKNYEISARLGYSNPDYFRQLFKAYTGMTPTEYRSISRRKLFC